MNRKTREQLEGVRRTFRPRNVRFWHTTDYEDRSATLDMFTEDLHLGLMPHKGRPQRQVELGLNGSETDKERAMLLLASISRDDYYDDCDTIVDAVETIAHYLSEYGEVVFEIVRDENAQAVGLSPFTPDSVRYVGVGWVQLIPVREREHLDRPKRMMWFRTQEVFAIRMAGELGGHRGLRRLLKRLVRFESFGPKFVQGDIEAGKWPAEVEFGDYHRQKQVLDYTITNQWGWNGRDASLEYQTEFYQVWRWLRFQKTKAILRHCILRRLNQFLADEQVNVTVFLRGLPTIDEMQSYEFRLLQGEIGFKEVYDGINL